MIAVTLWKMAGVKPGEKLPSYAWPGGYPLVYHTEDSEWVCPDCVNNVREFRHEDDPQWNVVSVNVYWEGPLDFCAHCNAEIESAYGDPEEEESHE